MTEMTHKQSPQTRNPSGIAQTHTTKILQENVSFSDVVRLYSVYQSVKGQCKHRRKPFWFLWGKKSRNLTDLEVIAKALVDS